MQTSPSALVRTSASKRQHVAERRIAWPCLEVMAAFLDLRSLAKFAQTSRVNHRATTVVPIAVTESQLEVALSRSLGTIHKLTIAKTARTPSTVVALLPESLRVLDCRCVLSPNDLTCILARCPNLTTLWLNNGSRELMQRLGELKNLTELCIFTKMSPVVAFENDIDLPRKRAIQEEHGWVRRENNVCKSLCCEREPVCPVETEMATLLNPGIMRGFDWGPTLTSLRLRHPAKVAICAPALVELDVFDTHCINDALRAAPPTLRTLRLVSGLLSRPVLSETFERFRGLQHLFLANLASVNLETLVGVPLVTLKLASCRSCHGGQHIAALRRLERLELVRTDLLEDEFPPSLRWLRLDRKEPWPRALASLARLTTLVLPNMNAEGEDALLPSSLLHLTVATCDMDTLARLPRLQSLTAKIAPFHAAAERFPSLSMFDELRWSQVLWETDRRS